MARVVLSIIWKLSARVVKQNVKSKMKCRYQIYCVFGPSTYTQDRITIWDRIAKLFGWLDWVELVNDTSAGRIETKLD